MQILWGFALLGRFDGKGYLVLNGQDYLSQKLLSYPLKTVRSFLSAFSEFGILCELVSEKIEDWLTPTGALKKGEWFLQMSFGKKIGGKEALKALKWYANGLVEGCGPQAFSLFLQADMEIFKVQN